jgi:threonine aldolase
VSAKYHFASDNTAGLCSEAWQVLQEVDESYVPSYGSDQHTDRACEAFREFFDTDCEVFFVYNGTAANSLALASLCQSYHSVIVHESAHVETDECGAPEFFSNGTKLLLGTGNGGRLSPEAVEQLITKRRDIHYPRPRVLSVSQPTELGTCYRVEELRELSRLASAYGLKVHMDGARFFHSMVTLGQSSADLTWRAGIDVLCFGGTKAGLGFSEAVVFFDKELATEFGYRCKQAGQLASKMSCTRNIRAMPSPRLNPWQQEPRKLPG